MAEDPLISRSAGQGVFSRSGTTEAFERLDRGYVVVVREIDVGAEGETA
jgi:hypothetical protein